VRPAQAGGGLGINPSSNEQKLIFSLNIPNSVLTSFDLTKSAAITDGAGVYIIMNPKIVLSKTPKLESYS
jgi:hypothetical protein